MGAARLSDPQSTSVEVVCLHEPGGCESVVDWGAGEPFRHVMLAPGTAQRCPACGETERFRVERAVPASHRFALGSIRWTPGFEDVCERGGTSPVGATSTLLQRHAVGDWGDLDPHDRRVNEQSVGDDSHPLNRGRLMSAYAVAGEKVWVITEAGRHATTLLLPEEY